MKIPNVRDKVPQLTRSTPLKSTYDSTFIVLVLSIAAILAIILVLWPSGGF
jgi:hypothetical protein